MTTALIYDPAYLKHETGHHPESPLRLKAILAALEGDELLWARAKKLQPIAASDEDITRCHSTRLVKQLKSLCERGVAFVDLDTALSSDSFDVARLAAGAAITAVDQVFSGEADNAFACVRPPGHHATANRAMGFCLLNNAAIGARYAQARYGAERVLIIDWDVHHGNGTAEIFRRRADVLFASIHQSGLFPGTGALGDPGSGSGLGYTINVPVPKGSDGDVWLSVLEHVIVPAALEFEPELVLISAGFDAHRADPLGDCVLESGSFAQMACQVRDLAAQVGAPVGAVLEGGYDAAALAECVLATVAALNGEGMTESIAPDPLITSRVAAHVGHFWAL